MALHLALVTALACALTHLHQRMHEVLLANTTTPSTSPSSAHVRKREGGFAFREALVYWVGRLLLPLLVSAPVWRVSPRVEFALEGWGLRALWLLSVALWCASTISATRALLALQRESVQWGTWMWEERLLLTLPSMTRWGRDRGGEREEETVMHGAEIDHLLHEIDDVLNDTSHIPNGLITL